MALVVDLHLRYGLQVLELNVTAEQRLALNTQKPTYLLSAGIKGMCHHRWVKHSPGYTQKYAI